MKSAIYPGTFDPITYGHIDVIKKSLNIFDRVIVATTDNINKNYHFSIEDRIKIINNSLFKGRSSKGIKGIQLKEKDKVISLSILDNTKIDAKTISKDKKIKNGVDKFILSVSENGYGKRSSYLDYRVTNRGGKGIIGIINSPRNGNISSTLVVNGNDEIILSTDKGSIMRCAVKEIRVAGRNTQGVRIKSLKGTEKVVSVIKIEDNIK